MVRELKLQYRGWFNLYSRTLQIGFLAFLSATLFFKPGHDTIAEGQRFLLDIFFAALVSIFAGFGKVSCTCCITHWASNVVNCVPAYAFNGDGNRNGNGNGNGNTNGNGNDNGIGDDNDDDTDNDNAFNEICASLCWICSIANTAKHIFPTQPGLILSSIV